MNRPTITVAVPTFNGREFLPATLESVLAQQFTDFELLVSDDASSDDSLDIVRSYRDSRLRIDTHHHLGMARNWNRCLRMASGAYVKLLPQDDVLHPECLSESLRLLRTSSRATLVFSRREIIYDATDPWCVEWVKLYGRLDAPLQPLKAVNDGPTLVRRWGGHDFQGNFVGEPATAMFPTQLARRMGGFPAKMCQDLDYAFWIRLMARGQVCFSETPLCAYRFHQANATSHNYQQGKLSNERFEFLKSLSRDRVLREQVPKVADLFRKERESLRTQMKWRQQASKVIGPLRRRAPELAAMLSKLILAPPHLANEMPAEPSGIPSHNSISQEVGEVQRGS